MIDSVMLEGAKFFMIFILILVVIALYYLFRFIFQPTRDLMAQPPIFFILLTAMGLGWLVWEIKHTRFMVRFLVTGFKLCPQTHSLLERFCWYRTVLVVTWRLHRLLRLHDKDKKRKKEKRKYMRKKKRSFLSFVGALIPNYFVPYFVFRRT